MNGLVVNKYSELEIKNILVNMPKENLTEEELDIVNSYIATPNLTPRNMFVISKVLNIDLSELLSKKAITVDNLSFRNKGEELQKEKLFTVLRFMVTASKQVELSGGH